MQAVVVANLCSWIRGLIGFGFYLTPVALLYGSGILFAGRDRPVAGRVLSTLLLPPVFGSLVHALACRKSTSFDAGWVNAFWTGGQMMTSGGIVGGIIGGGLDYCISVFGAVLVLLAMFLLLLAVTLRITPEMASSHVKKRAGQVRQHAAERAARPRPERPVQQDEQAPAFVPLPDRRSIRRAIDIPVDDPIGDTQEDPGAPDGLPENALCFSEDVPASQAPDKPSVSPPEPEPEEPESAPAPTMQEFSSLTPPPTAKQLRQEVVQQAAEIQSAIDADAAQEKPEYRYPPLTLLTRGTAATVDNREEVSLNRQRLDATLHSFGVNASIVDVTCGPTVTRYDLALEAGVKLSRLTNLSGDLALALGVSGVRIAPIPDKISTVGIEVPNKNVSTVYLRDIISSPAFQNASSRLSFAIGKDIGGNAIIGNIAKLPHMLIAGTTGSGKSVCMNSLILSLLYKSTPDEVRLIMIDPKMVELGVYNGIPHLYVPVVTDPKKAAGALQWSVVEMMKRYRLFSECGVRDLAGYNAYQKRSGGQSLPQVVIVIDELADLMLVASKEVEESICRVAQMGRASGMHLVIATQRPSADVITGLMKANIPSRIAFAVSSALESRIILDTQGAEKLIGMGDMLYAPLGAGKPLRVQGAFVSDEEREQVIGFIKAQNTGANYDEQILAEIEKNAAGKQGGKNGGSTSAEPEDGAPASSYDELLPQAVDVIFETKQASVSMLQRRLKLGYSRAARLVDQMEELGVVGPFEGSKPRQILITRQQWQERQYLSGTAPADMPASTQHDTSHTEESTDA